MTHKLPAGMPAFTSFFLTEMWEADFGREEDADVAVMLASGRGDSGGGGLGGMLQCNSATSATEKVFYFHRGLHDVNPDVPILVLIHGYPQSSFMWRHIIAHLPADIPLFIPDIPGYARSSPLATPHDKRSVGQAILEALRKRIHHNSTQAIVLAGHDRGARICHRIAVDEVGYSSMAVKGAMLMDIVPTRAQWAALGRDPAASTASFHWPFLAQAELATSMILAQGGDVWAKACIDRWAGGNPAGRAALSQHHALDIYGDFFKVDSVVRASCDDYRAAAHEDLACQEQDQAHGRKLDVDVLVIYSEAYLGVRHDMRAVWSEWMGRGSLDLLGLGDEVGHFIAEEAPEKTAAAIVAFYDHLNK